VRLLIVAATAQEIAPLVAAFGPLEATGPRLQHISHAGHEIDLLETGVGMVATAAWCSRAFASSTYDLAMNLGVCGSFDPALTPGSVVHVTAECLSELGAEDDEAFLSLGDLGLTRPDDGFVAGWIVNESAPMNSVLASLPAVRGITVNTAHGHPRTIDAVVRRWAPQVESMEGAAFMYCAHTHQTRCVEIRAVSNIVERRNRAAWKIKEAIANLNVTAARVIATL
jgi:futalosine hydrolase